MVSDEIAGLISRVQRRLRFNTAARHFSTGTVILCGIYLAYFICSRILSIIPLDVTPVSIPFPFGAALLLALIIPAGGTEKGAARAIDRKISEKDLFLAATSLSDRRQGFGPLVITRAVNRSHEINADSVVSLNIRKPLFISAVFLAFIIPAVLFFPRFDPFGTGEEEARKQMWRKKLQQTRKETQERKKALKIAVSRKTLSKEIEKAVQQLKTDLKNMKTGKKEGNLRNLKRNKDKFGELWKNVSDRKLGKSPGSEVEPQRFGRFRSKESARWKEKMDQGSAEGVRQEISEIRRMLKRLTKEKNNNERKKLRQEIGKRLEELTRFMSDDMQNTACSKALNRALDQLEMSGIEGLSAEALDALKESLMLSEMEAEDLARSIRDLKKLQKALKTIQQARRLNRDDMLDGICKDCNSLAEYEKLYREILSRCTSPGQETGPGMKGPGTGEGSKAPEDDSQKTEFKPEMSQSALNAGKILLKWKTREMGPSGRMNRDYAEAVDEVKNGVSEAIIKGDIPPFYHDAIKQYFDKVE